MTIFVLFVISLIFVSLVRFEVNPIETFNSFKEGDDIKKLIHPSARKFLKLIISNKIANNPEILNRHFNIKYLLLKFDFSLSEITQFLITKSEEGISKEALLKKAFEVGKASKATYIGEEVLFVAYLQLLTGWSEFLESNKKEKDWLDKTLTFVYWAKKRRRPVFFWDEDYIVPKMGGVNRGLTGRVTPILNQYSTDITYYASKALLPEPVGRRETLQKVVEILSRPIKNNVLLVGNPGSGRTSFLNNIAYKIVKGTSHKSLRFKRIVSIQPGAFFGSGKGSAEFIDRFNNVISEIELSGGIIAFVDEIHTLATVGVDNPLGSPIFGILEPKLASGNFQFIATTTPEYYSKYIEPHQSFARVFEKVDLLPTNFEETLEILEIDSFDTERRKDLVISYPAIVSAIRLSEKAIYDKEFPDKAVDVLEKAVSHALLTNSDKVGEKDVIIAIEDLTKVPASTYDPNNAKKLLNLEDEIHKYLVDQEEAVSAVADSLRREISGVRNTSRPIASFLFMGPTGVGKTELAKTAIKIFLGRSPNLIRFNMNQYLTKESAFDLIDNLANSIRQNPFSLILLDEFEKSYSGLQQVFLQLLDEGIITDSKRKTVKFNNAFFVATSNIGSHEIFNVLEKGGTFIEMKERSLGILKTTFSPELINRFSDIVVFKPLSLEDISKICKLKLDELKKEMENKKITLEFDGSVVKSLATMGYSREYGARQLDRVIKDKIESKLAKMVIGGLLRSGSKLTIKEDFLET